MPSPPTVQAVRVRLIYIASDSTLLGSRFYLSYSGSAPSAANCVTLATDIQTQWGDNLASLVTSAQALNEVDVIDLGSTSGASGQWTGSVSGTRSGVEVPVNCCGNVEFNIARRYRGGKPRMFLPPPAQADLADPGHWYSEYVSAANTHVADFFSGIEALSIGSMGTLAHVNISFYHKYSTTSPPWRGPGFKYPPAYRDTPLVDTIEGYDTKAVVGSQRRRRTSTTP